MDYRLKVIINGVEILEASETTTADEVESTSPSITNVKLYNNACNGTMVIGAAAQDALVFDMLNPYKLSFDGDKVEFYIAYPDDYETSTAEVIADDVGDDETTELIDVATINNDISEEVEAGEDLSDEDLLDIELTEAESTESQFAQLEGEDSEETALDEASQTEWTKVGEYYVNEQNTSDDAKRLTLKCYDGFCKLNEKFTPTVATASVQSIYDDLRAQVLDNYGLTIEAYEFPATVNKQITWSYICSYREAFGYLCGLVGGYATFTADGTGDISWYSYTGEILIKDDLTSYETNSAGEMVIDEIRCNKSANAFREDYLTIGGGQGIAFVNPFMDEDALAEIFEEYRDIRFIGAKVACAYTDSLQAGEFVRVFERAEYENYVGLNNAYLNDSTLSDSDREKLMADMNALGDVILISSQVVNFYGDASTVITSVCQSEASKANAPMGPNDAKFANLYAETITTRDLVADKADINMLNVTNANVRDLVAGSINGKVIKNSAVLAKALSNEMVETVLGVKVFYAGDAPTAENVGDIWYKTIADKDFEPLTDIIAVWDGEKWAETDFSTPDSIFMANSIVAQDINANEVTTNSAFMNLLQTRLARVGDLEKSHIDISGSDIKFNDADTELLSIKVSADTEFPGTTSMLSTNGANPQLALRATKNPNILAESALHLSDHSSDNDNKYYQSLLRCGNLGVQSAVDMRTTFGADNYSASRVAILAEGGAGNGAGLDITSNKNGVNRVKVVGDLHISDHDSPIGTYLVNGAAKTATYTTAGAGQTIDTMYLNKGTYIVTGECRFANKSNSTYRILGISWNTTGFGYQFTEVPAINGAPTSLQTVRLMQVTADNTPIYLRAQAGTGSIALDVIYLEAVRIA